MSTHIPDRWVVVEIEYEGEKVRRVLASWYGGFAGANSWKLSSGIKETKEFDNRYEFLNHSGSTYICFKNSEGMSVLTMSVYQSFCEQPEVKCTVIEYDQQK